MDPECRCAVMLLYGKKLAVLPFRKDLQEEGDPLEAKPFLENKKTVNILFGLTLNGLIDQGLIKCLSHMLLRIIKIKLDLIFLSG